MNGTKFYENYIKKKTPIREEVGVFRKCKAQGISDNKTKPTVPASFRQNHPKDAVNRCLGRKPPFLN
jgi:hypothetical protein